MLARNSHVFAGFKALFVASLLSGCVVTETNGSGLTTSGGNGGEAPTTAGATTTTATTTTAATTTTSTTGAGGGACVGETGKAVIADCDALNITPSTHGGGAAVDCGDNLDQEPPGYGLCVHYFDVFNTGAMTTLVDCLATIGVQDECKIDPVQACVDSTYAAECTVDSIKAACDGVKTTCGADPFDADTCAKDLNPFSEAGVQAVEDCINNTDPSVSCQKAYDDCYTTVISF
jgi:hypothetical protein